jgi:YgiT-type zinc finger domain-containing protein
MDRGENGCSYCGGNTHAGKVKTCLWEDRGVFIIEDIPARVCEKCFEQFYDEGTVIQIERLRRDGFPLRKARRVIEVPVFSLSSPEERAAGGKKKKSKPRREK